MTTPDDADRFRRAFADMTIDQVVSLRRQIVGPNKMPPGAQGKLAQAALDALLSGDKQPTPKQLAALELIVRMMRPSLLSTNRDLEDLPPEASRFRGWDAFRKTIRPSLYTVGRVDDDLGEGVGTGFLVSPTLLVTNTHVLDMLTNGRRVLERGQASVRFKREFNAIPDESPVDVVQVAAVHESLDISLLETDPVRLDADRKVLPLAEKDAARGDAIVVIGYPQNDSERSPMFITGIFGNRFGVKRAAPGEVIEVKGVDLFHDCSTLGGNSGSPVVSLESGNVIGVHRAGEFMYRNGAVVGSQLSAFVQAHI